MIDDVTKLARQILRKLDTVYLQPFGREEEEDLAGIIREWLERKGRDTKVTRSKRAPRR
jgi:hypothetical protein